MIRPDAMVEEAIVARVVHRSVLVDQPGSDRVIKLMFNLEPGSADFVPGSDIAFAATQDKQRTDASLLRYYTVEAVGEVPFEDSIDITIYVREFSTGGGHAVVKMLSALQPGDTVTLFGPFPYPFYPPMGSRSNMVMIGAGSGMAPFRWLAHKVHARKLDWMGKVLMLEGPETGLEKLYMNELAVDQEQYFDNATYRAFEALKTRYSAVASDRAGSRESNMDALWRLMGQGSVFVYVAGYRAVAEALDAAMQQHLRLPGRWHETKAVLKADGHWLEFLYD